MRVLVLGDMHLPWVNWRALRAAATFAEAYNPDVVVQVGDFIDGYNWSRFQRAPDAPAASEEWDMVERAARQFHDMFPGDLMVHIIEGNHDRRYQMRAFEANLPTQLVRPLAELFPYSNWNFWVRQRPMVIDGVDYIHGDEGPGNAHRKASLTGHSVVQGHLHRDAGVRYIDTFGRQVFGMDVGTLMDTRSIAGRYANKALLRSFLGWGTVTDGIPQIHPYRSRR